MAAGALGGDAGVYSIGDNGNWDEDDEEEEEVPEARHTLALQGVMDDLWKEWWTHVCLCNGFVL